MSILFVCRANVGRSQMAAALYTAITGQPALSAGTSVALPGSTVAEFELATNVIAAMHEIGIAIGSNIRTQLTPAIARDAEKIIVMAEPETIPDYLRTLPTVEYWTIADPKHMDMILTRRVRDELREQVSLLADRIGQTT